MFMEMEAAENVCYYAEAALNCRNSDIQCLLMVRYYPKRNPKIKIADILYLLLKLKHEKFLNSRHLRSAIMAVG